MFNLFTSGTWLAHGCVVVSHGLVLALNAGFDLTTWNTSIHEVYMRMCVYCAFMAIILYVCPAAIRTLATACFSLLSGQLPQISYARQACQCGCWLEGAGPFS